METRHLQGAGTYMHEKHIHKINESKKLKIKAISEHIFKIKLNFKKDIEEKRCRRFHNYLEIAMPGKFKSQ